MEAAGAEEHLELVLTAEQSRLLRSAAEGVPEPVEQFVVRTLVQVAGGREQTAPKLTVAELRSLLERMRGVLRANGAEPAEFYEEFMAERRAAVGE